MIPRQLVPAPPHKEDVLLDTARQIAARRTAIRQRRELSPGLTVLLWSLRIYVFLMLAVVIIQLTRLV
jgi:hypothetical protein